MRSLVDLAARAACSLVAMALVAGGAAGVQAEEVIPDERVDPLTSLNSQVDATNFIVNRGCSGTLISLTHRLVLTNYHCVNNFIRIVERDRTGPDGKVSKVRTERRDPVTIEQKAYRGHETVGASSYVTEIVAFKKNRDLAVLQIKADSIPHSRVSSLLPDTGKIVRGERVYVVGNPAGLDATMVEGVVSSMTRTFQFPWAENEDLPMIQYSGGTYGGNSGGALYNAKGYLIGVPAAAHRDATFIGLAIPVDIVKEVLKANCFESVWVYGADDDACRDKAKAEDKADEGEVVKDDVAE